MCNASFESDKVEKRNDILTYGENGVYAAKIVGGYRNITVQVRLLRFLRRLWYAMSRKLLKTICVAVRIVHCSPIQSLIKKTQKAPQGGCGHRRQHARLR